MTFFQQKRYSVTLIQPSVYHFLPVYYINKCLFLPLSFSVPIVIYYSLLYLKIINEFKLGDIFILMFSTFAGMGKHIASFAVSSILQTLSNNDYLNILSYNNTVKFVVPCFKDRLIPATRENIAVFMDAVVKLQPDEKSNVVGALEKAFKLLDHVMPIYFCIFVVIRLNLFSIEKKEDVLIIIRILPVIKRLCY